MSHCFSLALLKLSNSSKTIEKKIIKTSELKLADLGWVILQLLSFPVRRPSHNLDRESNAKMILNWRFFFHLLGSHLSGDCSISILMSLHDKSLLSESIYGSKLSKLHSRNCHCWCTTEMQFSGPPLVPGRKERLWLEDTECRHAEHCISWALWRRLVLNGGNNIPIFTDFQFDCHKIRCLR